MARLVVWILAALGLVFLVGVAAAIRWRLPLASWALRNSLADAGMVPRNLQVTELQAHHATIAPLDVGWKGQQAHVDSITIDRPDLFSRSLGHIDVKGVSVILDLQALDRPSDSSPVVEPKATTTTARATANVTFDELAAEGRLIARTSRADEMLTFSIQARPASTGNGVRATMKLTGPGMSAEGWGSYDFSGSQAEFELTSAQVELADARSFFEQFLPLPFRDWEVHGNLQGAASGRWAAGKLAGRATLRLRGGSLRNAAGNMSVVGVETDVVLTDLAGLTTDPAQLVRLREAAVGGFLVRDGAVRFQVKGRDAVSIESAEGAVLGGKVSAEAFAFDPAVVDYRVTLRCDGVRIEELLALFPTVNAKATGLADGLLPVHFGANGLSFGHGWVSLKSGHSGTLQIDQPGLLTGNLSPQSIAYPTLKAVETGLLNLRVTELRAEVYPPGAPADRSVQIRIAGEPMDPKIKAPVTFEVNVNGPIETLIHWGLDSRVKISSQ